MVEPHKITNKLSNNDFNPSGELAEIARNRATNPSFENVSGTNIYARNLFLNPGFVLGTGTPEKPNNTWNPTSCLVKKSTLYSGPNRNSCEITPTGSGFNTYVTVAGSTTVLTGHGVSFVPGVTYGVSVTMVVPSPMLSPGDGTSPLRRISVYYNTVSGATGGVIRQSNSAPNVAGEHRLTVDFTLPANTVWCEIRVGNGSNNPNDIVYVKDMVLVSSELLGVPRQLALGYFDGSTTPDEDLIPAWSSTANNSTSNLSSAGVASVNEYSSVNTYVASSDSWCSTGTRSVKCKSIGNGTDTFIDLQSSILGPSRTVPGTVIGVKFKIRLDAPLTGPTDTVNSQRQMNVNFKGTNNTIAILDSPYPNSVGVFEATGVFTVPEGVTGYGFVRVYMGYRYGEIMLDDFLVISGSSEAEVRNKLSYGYFGGTVSEDPDLVSSFVGSVNNSESVLKGSVLSNITPNSNALAVSSSQNLGSGGKSLRLIRTGPGPANASVSIPSTHVANGAFFSTVAQGTSEAGVSVDSPEVTSSGLGRRGVSWTEELDPPQKAVFRHSASSWDDVYFTDPVLADDSDYTGVYFDGDTGPFVYHSQMVTPSWDGDSSSFDYYDVSEVIWDEHGKKSYEVGVDHGVLYVPDQTGSYIGGVPWNGLVSVTESPSGAEVTKSYADNLPYLTMLSAEEFTATVEAYTYPGIFEECDGTAEPAPGVLVGQQPRRPFGLVYRTKIGDDINAMNAGYKLHLVYNAMAAPTEKAYVSVNDSPEPTTFSWELSTTSVAVNNELMPTSLITIDSRRVNVRKLNELEDVLFGRDPDNNITPTLPSPADVISMLE